ncbi:MAG TPA: glutathione peroxidase [Rhizomicrobium sp.]|nr:glutathione peroxidase [Rhizomicrobium sp.]
MTTVFDFTAVTLGGTEKSLAEFRGEVLLVVNTASQCGFTPQYEGLEQLYDDLHGRGFTVLGFPCNQFGKQEPGGAREIEEFCRCTYGLSFPMFDKIEVNGEGAHPLYKHLKRERRGLFGTESIKWNFTKFLVGRDGRAVARYAPHHTPKSLRAPIERLL